MSLSFAVWFIWKTPVVLNTPSRSIGWINSVSLILPDGEKPKKVSAQLTCRYLFYTSNITSSTSVGPLFSFSNQQQQLQGSKIEISALHIGKIATLPILHIPLFASNISLKSVKCPVIVDHIHDPFFNGSKRTISDMGKRCHSQISQFITLRLPFFQHIHYQIIG